MVKTNLFLSAAAALLLGACGEAQTIIPEETAKSGAEAVVATNDPKLYPDGPYGFTLDTVIPNLTFVGKRDSNGDGRVDDEKPTQISLSDFYGKKDVKLLAFLIAAEWCGPCNLEQGELVTSYGKLHAEGVEYLEAVTENNKGAPADIPTLDRWTGKSWTDQQTKKTGLYLPFPTVVDPTKIATMLGASAIPTQLIIRTSDMRIMVFNQGYGKGWLEANVNDQLSQL